MDVAMLPTEAALRRSRREMGAGDLPLYESLIVGHLILCAIQTTGLIRLGLLLGKSAFVHEPTLGRLSVIKTTPATGSSSPGETSIDLHRGNGPSPCLNAKAARDPLRLCLW